MRQKKSRKSGKSKKRSVASVKVCEHGTWQGSQWSGHRRNHPNCKPQKVMTFKEWSDLSEREKGRIIRDGIDQAAVRRKPGRPPADRLKAVDNLQPTGLKQDELPIQRTILNGHITQKLDSIKSKVSEIDRQIRAKDNTIGILEEERAKLIQIRRDLEGKLSDAVKVVDEVESPQPPSVKK